MPRPEPVQITSITLIVETAGHGVYRVEVSDSDSLLGQIADVLVHGGFGPPDSNVCRAEGPDLCRWKQCLFPGPFGPVDRAACPLEQPVRTRLEP